MQLETNLFFHIPSVTDSVLSVGCGLDVEMWMWRQMNMSLQDELKRTK